MVRPPMQAVLAYLEKKDGAAGAAARQAFECFEPYGHDEQEYAQVCVIGPEIRRNLFGYGPAIGKFLKVNDVWLEVIGIFSGYFGGTFDLLFQRVLDVWISFPPIVLLVTIVTIFSTRNTSPVASG